MIDICTLSHRVIDLGKIDLNFEREATRIGQKINIHTTKDLSLTGH